MRTLVAAAAALLLAGCSSAPEPAIDIDSWTPPDPDLTSVECGDLLAEWGTGAEEAPLKCWTFEETDGLPDRFAALVDDLSDHADAEPERGPSCMTTVACQAEWASADGVVALSSSLTLTGLEAELEAGGARDQSAPRLYELTVWSGVEPLMSDDEWDEYYESIPD